MDTVNKPLHGASWPSCHRSCLGEEKNIPHSVHSKRPLKWKSAVARRFEDDQTAGHVEGGLRVSLEDAELKARLLDVTCERLRNAQAARDAVQRFWELPRPCSIRTTGLLSLES